jgi:hypothetical protein
MLIITQRPPIPKKMGGRFIWPLIFGSFGWIDIREQPSRDRFPGGSFFDSFQQE